jgi:peptidoglycan/xylan/chitin deacetylase (PgdA/CDA1 family)
VRQCIVLLLVAALVAVAGAGCGSDPEPAPSPVPTTPTASPAPTPTFTPSPPATPTPTTTGVPASPAPTTPTWPPTTSAVLPEALTGRILTAIPTSERIVALTFDAGASDAGVPAILATLAEQRITATFFVTGGFARRYPNAVRAMAEAGHVIGSHSDTHPDFTTLTTADRAAQLTDAQAAIGPLIDGTTKPWFRFPFGAADPAAIAEVNGNGYACIGWTVDTLGWKGTSGGQSVDTVVSRVLAALQPGEIVLMHVGANPEDGSTLDAAALPTIIGDLRERDYGFVTLAAALP